MISVKQKGDLKKTFDFMKRSKKIFSAKKLEKWARRGVEELSKATPMDTGKTASSWDYVIKEHGDDVTIYFTNSNISPNGNVPVAVLLQYGHSTKNGGYVQGVDYINPALIPIFDSIVKEAWEDLKS